MAERQAPFKKDDKIRLISMENDPQPIEPGTKGVVEDCTWIGSGMNFWQVFVKWENGRGLMLSVPPDRAEVIK